MNKFLVIFFFVGFTIQGYSQADSLQTNRGDSITKRELVNTKAKKASLLPPDSGRIASVANPSENILLINSTDRDSLSNNDAHQNLNHAMDSIYRKLINNPFFNSNHKPLYLIIREKKRNNKDDLFYLISALVFLLGFIKLVFNKYFTNISRLFFQPSFRQKQTTEQLLQSNLPSFFLNIFFVLSAGAYLSLITQYYSLVSTSSLLLFLYLTTGLLIIYFTKFLILSFSGWVFGVQAATDAYSFIVFLVNKVLGIILLPFIIIIAFGPEIFVRVSIVLSSLIIFCLFLYRYIAAIGPVMRGVKVGFLHFFIYIMGLEIIPLFIIYKMLLNYLYK